ncbi:MAG: ATP-binding protein [Gemmatimonadetes bacterium]|nr:ATP-binding protein [Gemmatimonadota bacterium]MCY3677866.1 ATP-binding protein [Gemmatimonadota bacterium]MYA42907.1 ATP-binding protein [Gemmatimonadota bacterium]MYE93734.1 ATP-binding protein [Gemmatimonadota bacterium]MYJ09405.1 ATP-binding protein [Gemmatimonadota bacterium]
MLIDRPVPTERIRRAFSVHPVVALTGPRQCGKTTLAREIAARTGQSSYFDLEEASSRRRLATPEYALGRLEGLVVIDEVQRSPALFETLRVLVDRPGNAARFLLLGSASPSLVRGVSESLAGRVGLVDLGGFDVGEVTPARWRKLWLRGGFPRSFLTSPEGSEIWRRNFVRTFLERDLPQLGITIPAERLRRFWTMIAHYHGQTWNAAEFARSLGTSEGTARNYLDILAGAFMVRVLPPWFENIRKRQVRSPKTYVRDTGVLHTLLGLDDDDEVAGHPKVGASFEGFAIEQLLVAFDVQDAYFWGTHGGAELDLLVLHRGARYGFECKFADAPGPTRSMRVALRDLRLDHLWIVFPGAEAYSLDERISVLPISGVQEKARELTRRRARRD